MRIAHISDLHLRHHLNGSAPLEDRLCRDMPGLLGSAIEEIRVHAPDVLVVTGDLVDYPLEALDDPAIQELGRQDLQLIRSALSDLPFPVLVTHGNHDHPQLFHEIFADYPHDLEVGAYWLRLFFDHEGPHHIPQRLGRQRARFLSGIQSDSGLRQIHLQHYVVWPLLAGESYPTRYGEAAWLHDQLIASGQVQLVLSGHYHHGVPLFQEQNVWFATARAFCETPHPYTIYQIEADSVYYQEYSVSGSNQLGIERSQTD